jgi:hypothetical protein
LKSGEVAVPLGRARLGEDQVGPVTADTQDDREVTETALAHLIGDGRRSQIFRLVTDYHLKPDAEI